jgi:hypothetical protein
MAVSITDHFGIDKPAFAKTGALDAVLDIDSLYFLDPKSLKATQIPEFANSYLKLETNFENILKLLKQSKGNDIFWQRAYQLLPQGELKGLNLGYSISGTRGSGFGPKHKRVALKTAKQIVDAGVEDPVFFELLGVFQKGIGPDRISDLVCLIIADDIIAYSERVFASLGIQQTMTYKRRALKVPRNPSKNEPVLVLPEELLRDLPVANDWSDIDEICSHNQALRNEVNSLIGNTWKRATSKSKDKDVLKRVLLQKPDLLRNMVDLYNKKEAKPYNFRDDPAGELIWYEAAKSIAEAFPLQLGSTPNSKTELVDMVRTIVLHFKQLIENNGQYELLYRDNQCKKPKPERAAQKLFFAVADAYCKANDIDISPETHSGRGSVDFKFSRGYSARVIVETKLTPSSSLVHGYETQISEYAKAEKVTPDQCFYLPILVTGSSPDRIKLLEQARGDMIAKKQTYPELISVNAQYKKSASKK